MKALIFGEARDKSEPQREITDSVDEMLSRLSFGLHDIDDARPLRPDWVVTKPILAGICGSDSKLVLGDFSDGDMDNPMSAFSSIPHVPGHEVVAEVAELGPKAKGVEVGQRVVVNPWLTCAPRGITPICPPCQSGDYTLCWSFTKGELGPGVHLGVITKAPGAWAEAMAAHDSMLFGVPDGITNEEAVLADPFAVSFHAIVRNPPLGERVLVYGAGALGQTSIAILSALYPKVEIGVVARFGPQKELAKKLGASKVFSHEPAETLIEELAEWSGGVLHRSFMGLGMTRPGGIDTVYDTIGKAESFEIATRVLRERATLVYTGVATPSRWEWTPVYFKELTITGSNAFGKETLEGKEQHAIAHYLDLVEDKRIDLTPMLTHRFGLKDWWSALRALVLAEESGALKVAFEPSLTS